MSDADLRLNSLDRFRKRSKDLVLEEHGSCEIPAGCGGVVLRWVRRGQERADLHVNLATRGQVEAWLNGQALQWGGARVTGAGPHVLAISIRPTSSFDHLGLIQASVSSTGGARSRPIVTAADGTWRAALQRPGDGWTSAGYDDRGWTALVERPLPAASGNDFTRQRLTELGATPLGLPDGTNPAAVWIRHTFELERGTA